MPDYRNITDALAERLLGAMLKAGADPKDPLKAWRDKYKPKASPPTQAALFGDTPVPSKPKDYDFYSKPFQSGGTKPDPEPKKPSAWLPKPQSLSAMIDAGQHGTPHTPYVPKLPGPDECHWITINGHRVCINDKHTVGTPTPKETWSDPNAMAVWAKDSPVGAVLNGIPIQKWTPPENWKGLAGLAEFPEPPPPIGFKLPPEKDKKGKWLPPEDAHMSAGVLIQEPDGRWWVVSPTHNYGGYAQTFPKGTVDAGSNLQETAIREAWEESGLKVKLVGYLGDYKGDTSITRYYLARRSNGSPADFGKETHQVKLVPASLLRALLNKSRDQQIFDDLVAKGYITLPKGEAAKAKRGNPNHLPAGNEHGGEFAPKDDRVYPTTALGRVEFGTVGSEATETTLELAEVYHGTTSDVLDRLMKEGLKPHTATYRSHSGLVTREPAVFLTPMEESADFWAMARKATILQEGKLKSEQIKPIILKINVPAGTTLRVDTHAGKDNYYFTDTIPPSWIEGWYEGKHDDSGNLLELVRGKAAGKIYYVPIIIVDEGTSKKAKRGNPNHLPAGDEHGGEFAPKASSAISSIPWRNDTTPNSVDLVFVANNGSEIHSMAEMRKRLGLPNLVTGDVIRMSGAPPDSTVEVVWNDERADEGGYELTVRHPFLADNGMQVSIAKKDEGLVASFDHLYLKDDAPIGTGTKVVARMVTEMQRHGFKGIYCVAAGSIIEGKRWETGYYAWPRMGFDASLWKGSLPPPLPPNLVGANKISDLMMTQDGRDWWKENGSRRHCYFDLTPGSLSLRVMTDYLKEKGYATKDVGGLDFSAEDEAILDRIWDAIGHERQGETKKESSDLLAVALLEGLKEKVIPVNGDGEQCHWVTIHGHPVCLTDSKVHAKPIEDASGIVTGHAVFNAPQSKYIDAKLSAWHAGKFDVAQAEVRMSALLQDNVGTNLERGLAKANGNAKAIASLGARISRNNQEHAALIHIRKLMLGEYKHTGIAVEATNPPTAPIIPAVPVIMAMPLPPTPVAPVLPAAVPSAVLVKSGSYTPKELAAKVAEYTGLPLTTIKSALTEHLPPSKNSLAKERAKIESAILTHGLAIPDAIQQVMSAPYHNPAANKVLVESISKGPMKQRAVEEFSNTAIYDLNILGGINVENNPVYGQANCQEATRVLTMGSTSVTGDFRHELGHAIHAIIGGKGKAFDAMGELIDKHRTSTLEKVKANSAGVKVKMTHEFYETTYGEIGRRGIDDKGESFAEFFRGYNKYAFQDRSGTVPGALAQFNKRFPDMAAWFNSHYTAALLGEQATNGEW